jgi:hypothetical protein
MTIVAVIIFLIAILGSAAAYNAGFRRGHAKGVRDSELLR